MRFKKIGGGREVGESKQKGSTSQVGKGVRLATYEKKKGNDIAKLNRKFTQRAIKSNGVLKN